MRFFTPEKRLTLSPQSVAHIRSVPHNVLEKAVKYGDVPTNQVERTDSILDAAEAVRFLKCTSGDRLEAAYWVVLTLRLREGEVFGLRWADIDFERRTWRVTH